MEPRVSVSQITTFRSTFADGVRAYAAAGLAGIGIWEMKLGDGDDAEALELLDASGLEAATAVRRVPSILRALDAAGWDGLYDIEIFSDDGTFGSEYPDSLWAAPTEETLARARVAFERCWSMAHTPQEVEETR